MSRFSRKNREDIVFKGSGGLDDVIDDFLKELWRVDDNEYNYISEFATDEELTIILPEFKNFGEKREAIKIVNRLVEECRFISK